MAAVNITSEVVRVVQGHPAKAKQKLDNNNQPVFKDGKPVMQWFFAVAIPKHQWPPFQAAMSAAAADIPGNNNPKFAWKFKDGDAAVDSNGKPYREKPGMAGCMILSITTEFQATTIYRRNAAGGFDVMPGDEFKCGYFVRVSLKIEGHAAANASQTPGLYINPQGVEFVAFGEEIMQGPDAMQMFGAAPQNAALPPGASATPVVSATAATPPGFNPAPTLAAAPAPMMPGPTPALPPGYPSPSAAPPSPGPTIAPAAAPSPVTAAAYPAPTPAPIASPSSPMPAAAPAPAPAYDIARGQVPIAYVGTRPVYQYFTDANGQQWPVYGWDQAGNPVYQ